MELEITMFKKRLFIQLDDGWYERPVKYVEYKGDKTND